MSDNAVASVDLDASALTEKQRAAVSRMCDVKHRIVAVTGPAGSGKTTIMRFGYQNLVDAGYTVVIAAPTGRAARRIKEATGVPAVTIHKLLEYTSPREINPKTGKPYGDTYPRRDKENPLSYDAVIVDEYSMVTQELHRNLVDALKPGARLMAFGDTKQLAPVETKEAMQVLTPSFTRLLTNFDGIVLDAVHRQAADSGIIYNANRLLAGLGPVCKPDFDLIITGPGNSPVDAVAAQVVAHKGFDGFTKQVLTPSNKSWIGTHSLSATLQTVLMPNNRKLFKLPRRQYQGKQYDPDVYVGVGDKVIINKNWYDLECSNGTSGVFNGEIGVIKEITDLEEVVVDFEDRTAVIPPIVQVVVDKRVLVGYPQWDLYLAYAITTHKAQGSEYEHIIYVIDKSVSFILNRRNFYTAITRARKKVTLIGDTRSIGIVVSLAEQRIMSGAR